MSRPYKKEAERAHCSGPPFLWRVGADTIRPPGRSPLFRAISPSGDSGTGYVSCAGPDEGIGLRAADSRPYKKETERAHCPGPPFPRCVGADSIRPPGRSPLFRAISPSGDSGTGRVSCAGPDKGIGLRAADSRPYKEAAERAHCPGPPFLWRVGADSIRPPGVCPVVPGNFALLGQRDGLRLMCRARRGYRAAGG